MCDTLWLPGAGGALFAKNSDRPAREAQLVASHPARPAAAVVPTQYLRLPDPGAIPCLLARPVWLWGAEHGVNSERVAVGNEKVWGVDDPAAAPAALIGMDLVRLALERSRTAAEALEVLTGLLGDHGQGGICDEENDEAYWSSFLLADPTEAWVLETSGRTWAARPSTAGVAISNRIGLRADWTRASADVPPGADFDRWRDPSVPTGRADGRLAAGRAYLAGACPTGPGAAPLDPAGMVGHLRDHGTGPWGAPGSRSLIGALPGEVGDDGSGVTVCMHLRGDKATTSSMVTLLPADPDEPTRAWIAPGSPCCSVYLPVLAPASPAPLLADPAVWWRFAALRDVAEAQVDAIGDIRAVLDPLEDDLWAEGALLGADPAAWDRFVGVAGARVLDHLDRLDRVLGLDR